MVGLYGGLVLMQLMSRPGVLFNIRNESARRRAPPRDRVQAMAKFYFDFVVRERLIPDHVGRDLESAQCAVDEAQAIADDLAATPPDADEDWHGMLLRVRSASNEEVASFVVR